MILVSFSSPLVFLKHETDCFPTSDKCTYSCRLCNALHGLSRFLAVSMHDGRMLWFTANDNWPEEKLSCKLLIKLPYWSLSFIELVQVTRTSCTIYVIAAFCIWHYVSAIKRWLPLQTCSLDPWWSEFNIPWGLASRRMFSKSVWG